MNRVIIALLVGLVVLVIGGTLYFSNQQPANNPITIQNPVIQPTSSSTMKIFQIQSQNFSFTPNEIRLNKGDRVKIELIRQEGFHDLVIDEFNVKTQQLQAGQTDSIEFTADKTGTFEFYCSVNNHRQMGMVGKFIVE